MHEENESEQIQGWLVGCFGLNGPLKQYFSLYRAVSTNTGKNKLEKPILNPTIQVVDVNLYTKHDFSVLNGCGDVLDVKRSVNEKKNIQGRTNRGKSRKKTPQKLTQ